MNSILPLPENKRNRRLTLRVETFDQNLLQANDHELSSHQIIDEEGFNESLSSEYSDKSFRLHMKRIIRNKSSDKDSESRSVTTDSEFKEVNDKSIKSKKFDKTSGNLELKETFKDPTEEQTRRL